MPIRHHVPESWGCRVIRTTAQTIGNAAIEALSFNSAIYNSNAGWAIGAPTRLYGNTHGYYMAGASLGIPAPGVTPFRFWMGIRKNGTIYLAHIDNVTTASTYLALSLSTGMFWLDRVALDYIEIVARQYSAGNLDTDVATASNQHTFNGWLQRIY